ncbi:MAG: hypothetical protein A2V69_03640 [Candidatus Portnoybacteria bacterium RBG_13_40_8]|uniref:DUF4258 domain-containing protein n=1 Tax=Candidatus Portnoybacteria bacterium RBG_13_40_8 TaxID=1801990 RepID=A0A1G2F4I7_9BACT|nr:MAG: hypothetical protein A2V69_03640 [Candidatus Portnoybacteria bacterium RBG_13_40_8]
MKEIIYSSHLIFRLKLREIPYDLPKIILLESNEHYFDKQTKKRIAIKSVDFKNELRDMAIIYNETENQIILITIHPLKKYQKFSRINSGRWQKL